jgi:hypothetical protein
MIIFETPEFKIDRTGNVSAKKGHLEIAFKSGTYKAKL